MIFYNSAFKPKFKTEKGQERKKERKKKKHLLCVCTVCCKVTKSLYLHLV